MLNTMSSFPSPAGGSTPSATHVYVVMYAKTKRAFAGLALSFSPLVFDMIESLLVDQIA